MIVSQTKKEFEDWVFSHFSKGRRHAGLLYAHWMRTGTLEGFLESVEPQAQALCQEMIDHTDFSLPEIVSVQEDERVKKLLLRFEDGQECESVLIAMEQGNTLCVSSQVGCQMACGFCETGKMGLVRSLTAGEIVMQLFCVRYVLKCEVRNIVFMGMGEPFDNFDAVMQAVQVFTDMGGCGFGMRRITISTSGHVEGILRFAKEADPALNLAVSVTTASDVLRNRLMPINKQWDLATLRDAMELYLQNPLREILVGVVLIDGVNDSVEDARLLVQYLKGLRVKINCIPLNVGRTGRLKPSAPERIDAFIAELRKGGFQVLLRHSRGDKVMAACGQLVSKVKTI